MPLPERQYIESSRGESEPRGVTATLYTRMSEAMAAATDHLVASVDYTCGGAIDSVALAGYSQHSYAAIDRA